MLKCSPNTQFRTLFCQKMQRKKDKDKEAWDSEEKQRITKTVLKILKIQAIFLLQKWKYNDIKMKNEPILLYTRNSEAESPNLPTQ